ncbi:uncharacterized protein LOC124120947 [Haliotis rufescens]|uniref:uncharacterized protein LOC124120947 n=1 Tax=Haliotis rufescens TaxID=6454 RepID=UPI00201FAC8E|nr:uncharacterized protein LOC124120947 [Haliotis rufescens]
MKLLLILLLFAPDVVAKMPEVQTHLFQRVFSLDNINVLEIPSSFSQCDDFLECGSICSRDDLCVAMVHYDGECYTYASSVSPSGIAKPGARAYTKRRAKTCPPDFHQDKEARLCVKIVANPYGTFNEKRCTEQSKDARPAQIQTARKHRAVVIYVDKKGTMSNVFVGGRTNAKGAYSWLDGTAIRSNMWCLGSSFGQKCVQLWTKGGFCLKDCDCYSSKEILCEVPLNE